MKRNPGRKNGASVQKGAHLSKLDGSSKTRKKERWRSGSQKGMRAYGEDVWQSRNPSSLQKVHGKIRQPPPYGTSKISGRRTFSKPIVWEGGKQVGKKMSERTSSRISWRRTEPPGLPNPGPRPLHHSSPLNGRPVDLSQKNGQIHTGKNSATARRVIVFRRRTGGGFGSLGGVVAFQLKLCLRRLVKIPGPARQRPPPTRSGCDLEPQLRGSWVEGGGTFGGKKGSPFYRRGGREKKREEWSIAAFTGADTK